MLPALIEIKVDWFACHAISNYQLLHFLNGFVASVVSSKMTKFFKRLTTQTPDRAHKTDRLPQVSFERRWSAAPAQSNPVRGDSGQRKQPQAERRIKKIPFSCELAFSRVVTKGNFSTRCMARAHESGTVALG